MSMLKAFLEIGCDEKLFEVLEIRKDAELCREYMGKFPVLSISLKGVSGADFAAARGLLCSAVGNEAMRFQFLLEDDRLTDREKELYKQIIRVDKSGNERFFMSDSILAESLKPCRRCLKSIMAERSLY